MIVLIFVFAFFSHATVLTQAQSCGCSKPVCTRVNIRNSAVLTPEQIKKSNLDLINKLWSQKEPVLTILGNDLKDVILDMSTSENPKFRAVSLMVTAWVWSYIPHLNSHPNLCNFATLINETVNHDTFDNCFALKKAIDQISGNVKDVAKFESVSTYQNAGCKHDPLQPSNPRCYSNGTVYMGDELWEIKGDKYQGEFEVAALNLYYSNNYMDQVMGAIATACITDSLYEYLNNCNTDVLFPLYSAKFTEVIPEECCSTLMIDMNKLVSKLPDVCIKAAEGAKRNIGCEAEKFPRIDL